MTDYKKIAKTIVRKFASDLETFKRKTRGLPYHSVANLASKTFEFLGSGVEAEVYAVNKDKVLKVSE